MATRVMIGVVLCVIGAIWVLQGLNAVKGSGMSGHGQWTIAGAVLVIAGLALVRAGIARRRR